MSAKYLGTLSQFMQRAMILWSIEPNAFLKSIQAIASGCCFLEDRCIRFFRMKEFVGQPSIPETNPLCTFEVNAGPPSLIRMMLCCCSLLARRAEKVLYNTDKRQMGLQFPQSEGSPFLYKSEIWPFFQQVSIFFDFFKWL